MITLILMLNLAAANIKTQTVAQVSTCQYPNTCKQQPVTVAQVSTCQYPNTCKQQSRI